MKPMNSRSAALLAALCASTAVATSCADPATQPQVAVSVRGLNAVTSNRGSGLGDVTIEVLFAPAVDGGANRPHRRLLAWHNVDVETFTAQVTAGRYTVTASAYTVVECNRAPTQVTLGTSASAATVEVPVNNAMTVDLTLNRAAGTCP